MSWCWRCSSLEYSNSQTSELSQARRRMVPEPPGAVNRNRLALARDRRPHRNEHLLCVVTRGSRLDDAQLPLDVEAGDWDGELPEAIAKLLDAKGPGGNPRAIYAQ